MNLQAISQKLQFAGFKIDAHQIKESGKWESVSTLDNKSGRKSGRYIIGDNICSWVNNKTQEKGSFVLDQARVVSSYELERKRREYAKAERDKYFTNAIAAKEKFNTIKTSPNFESEYLDRKGSANYGGKIDENGNFIIPLRSLDVKADGTRVSYIRSLQTILPDGTKLLESGCEKKGNMHIVGFGRLNHRNAENYAGEILIAEGYATATSIYMATGKPVVVAIDAGNLDPVMAKLTKAYPQAKLTICADNDLKTELESGRNVGVQAAMACQEKYGCNVVIPDFIEIDNNHRLSDYNDLHCSTGLEAVTDQINAGLNLKRSPVAEPSINLLKENIMSTNQLLEKQEFAEMLKERYVIGQSAPQQVIDNLYNDYQKYPDFYNTHSDQFNPERIDGIASNIPAEKFDGYGWNQSWIIKASIKHHDVDPTTYITPENSYSKIFVVAEILKDEKFNPKEFSDEQLNKLAEILKDENYANEVNMQLLNPIYSVADMTHIQTYASIHPEEKLNVKQEIERIRQLEADAGDKLAAKINEIIEDKELPYKDCEEPNKFILTDHLTDIKIGVNTNADVLKHFEQYDKNNAILGWIEDGKVKTEDGFHFLDNENPCRLANVLNREFKTEVKVESLDKAIQVGSNQQEKAAGMEI